MATCTFRGCVNEAHALGYCQAHYKQSKRGNGLKPLQQQFHGLSEIDRFKARLAVQPNGCWKWMGSILKKTDRPQREWYGQWRNTAGKHEVTHRAAWRLLVGPIPTRACVLHRCDNAQCCNPDHLFLGTQADNVKDMWDKGRAKPGTSLGEAHGMSKLNGESVRDILSSPLRGVDLAKKYGVSKTTITDIRKRRIWAHIK